MSLNVRPGYAVWTMQAMRAVYDIPITDDQIELIAKFQARELKEKGLA
jgi:hypothetical protein